MKKISKAVLNLFVAAALMLSSLCLTAAAEGSYISFSKSSVNVGDSLTVTVTFSSDEAMSGVKCVVNYNSDVLEYKSGNATGSAGTLTLVESPSNEKKVSYSLTFTAKTAGSSVVSLADCQICVMGSNGAAEKQVSGASATVTVKDAALSSNANLKALSVSVGKLSPSFSASKTSYKVSVGADVTECAVYATAADSGAKVEVSGSKALNMGDNVRTVTVTAPSGAQKVYTVTVNRSENAASDGTESDITEVTSPLETVIDGIKYEIATDISDVKLFDGFTVAEELYNGQAVSVARDSGGYYTLYYLKAADSEEKAPYVLNSQDNSFARLIYFTSGENTYISASLPDGKTLPDGYYATAVEISGMNVSCFASNNSGLSDFYYLYCFNGTEYAFYRYDTKENTVQRYPELTAVDSVPVSDTASADDGIAERFKTLSTNAKIIVLGLLLVAIGLLALIVLVIVRLAGKKRFSDYDADFDGMEGFDEIIDESFSLLTDDTSAPAEETVSQPQTVAEETVGEESDGNAEAPDEAKTDN